MAWFNNFSWSLFSFGKKRQVRDYYTRVRQRRYWQNNSIYLDNIYNKIATDVALMKFKHVKVQNGKWQDMVQSELMNLVSFSPNEDETPMVFWSSVVRTMLQRGCAVVVPIYRNRKIVSLELAIGAVEYAGGKIAITFEDGTENTVNKSDVWIFENPKINLTAQLGRITNLIDDNLIALSEKLDGTTIKAFISLPTKLANDELQRRAEYRRDSIIEVAKNGGIGFLEKGEELKELNKPINTVSSEELEFLKAQLYQAFGINESLFTCDYTEMQFRAYFSSVIKVYHRIILEEINRKYFTSTARSQGQKLLAFHDMFDVTSLKDLTEFANKMVYNGINNPNEIREIIGLAPYDGGDIYRTNKNADDVNSGGKGGDEINDNGEN